MVRRSGKFVWHRATASEEVIHRAQSGYRLLRDKRRRAVNTVRNGALLVLGTVVALVVYGPMITSGFVALGGNAKPR